MQSKIQRILADLSLRGIGNDQVHQRTGVPTQFLVWLRGGHMPAPAYSVAGRYADWEIQHNCQSIVRLARKQRIV